MIAYVDSSVVLRALFLNDIGIRYVFGYSDVFSSELLSIECKRVVQRYRIQDDLDDTSLIFSLQALQNTLQSIKLIPLSSQIKTVAASPFPTVIGTLDALHLATALVLSEQLEQDVLVFTYDRQLNMCAAASGLGTPFFDELT